MSQAASEAPAAYVLATQFHEVIQELVEGLEPTHDHMAIELLRYAERIVGNVGAAEAPYAAERRQRHYQMAFSAACGCAAACDLVHALDLGEGPVARRANQLLANLARLIRPIAEEGMEARSETEEAILDGLFGELEDDDDATW